MRLALTMALALAVAAGSGTARATSMAEITGTMATGSAVSSGAATGASSAHAAMSAVVRNLPTPMGMPADSEAAPARGAHTGGTGGGWTTACSGHQATGQSKWAHPGSTMNRQGQSGWLTGGSGRQAKIETAWAKATGRSACR